jgi:predicted DNA-binding transcriptional regulator AlpA
MQYISFQSLQAKLDNRSRSSIYRDIKVKRLPEPIKFGSRLFWLEQDIDDAIRNTKT